MPKLRKVDGAWRDVSDRYRKVDGQWRKVVESYTKVDGIWIKSFGTPYIQPIIRNPDPQKSSAGVFFDDATQSWRAYIEGKPSEGYTVEAGIIIKGIPPDSILRLRLAKYSGVSGEVRMAVSSGAINHDLFTITNDKLYYSFFEISNELTVVTRLTGTGSERQANFALYEILLNYVSLPLI